MSHSLRLFSFHRLDKDRYIISPSLDEHEIIQMTKSWEKGQEERQRPLNSTSPRIRSPRKGFITERSMEKGGAGGNLQRISSNSTPAMPMSTPVAPLPSGGTNTHKHTHIHTSSHPNQRQLFFHTSNLYCRFAQIGFGASNFHVSTFQSLFLKPSHECNMGLAFVNMIRTRRY